MPADGLWDRMPPSSADPDNYVVHRQRLHPEDTALHHEMLLHFEDIYTRHLEQRQAFWGAVGGLVLVGASGALGSALLPAVLLLSPAKVALASVFGAAGGSRLRWSREAAAQGHVVGNVQATPPQPTLRRLTYVVAWAQRRLSSAGGTVPEWRHAVLNVVTHMFSPWAQRAHFCKARDIESAGHTIALRHLVPLYRFLCVATDEVLELVGFFAATWDRNKAGGSSVDRRRITLATMVTTIEEMDKLNVTKFAKLAQQILAQPCTAPLVQVIPRHHRLQRIAEAIRTVLTVGDVQEALSCVPPVVLPGDASSKRPHDADEDDDEFLSIGDDLDFYGPGSGFQLRSIELPRSDGGHWHTWGVVDPSNIKVRSKTYLSDGRKERAGAAMLELLSVDFSRVSPLGPVGQVATHGDFCPAACRRIGDRRFLFVMNWILPPYQCVFTAALDPSAPWLAGEGSPQACAWGRFLAASPEERSKRLKVICFIEEGPWVVKKLAVKKPVVIGKKLTMTSYHEVGDYIEVVIDVTNGGSGGYEEMVVGTIMRQMGGLKLCFCALIEGQHEDELPEAPLFACGGSGLNVERFHCPVLGLS